VRHDEDTNISPNTAFEPAQNEARKDYEVLQISSMRRLGSAQTAEYKDDGAKAGKVADVCDNL